MTEERYRLIKAILLSAFVAGILWSARSFSETYRQRSEAYRQSRGDGRYQLVQPGAGLTPWKVIDTRTGQILLVSTK